MLHLQKVLFVYVREREEEGRAVPRTDTGRGTGVVVSLRKRRSCGRARVSSVGTEDRYCNLFRHFGLFLINY